MSIGKQQKLWKNSYQVPATIIHSHHYFWMCSHLYEMSVSELERKSHFILNDELAVDIPVSSVNCYTTKEKAVLARLTEKNPSMGSMVICFGSVCCLLFVRSHVYLGQSILHHFSVCLSLSLFSFHPYLVLSTNSCTNLLAKKPSTLINYMTFLLFLPIFIEFMGLIVSLSLFTLAFWPTQ